MLVSENNDSGLSLQQFLNLADIFEYYNDYEVFLLKGFILFIFTAFNTQDIFGSHLDIIDEIFSKYNDDILSALNFGDVVLEKLMLKVLIKLTIKIFEDEYQSEIITSLLTSVELNDFVHKCITDTNDETDDELKELSRVFIEKTAAFF